VIFYASIVVNCYRRNPNDWQILKLNDLPSLERSFFNPAVNTKIYAIGWDNDGSIANSTKDGTLFPFNFSTTSEFNGTI